MQCVGRERGEVEGWGGGEWEREITDTDIIHEKHEQKRGGARGGKWEVFRRRGGERMKKNR